MNWVEPGQVPTHAMLRVHFTYVRNIFKAVGFSHLLSNEKREGDRLTVIGHMIDALSSLGDPYHDVVRGRLCYGLGTEKIGDIFGVSEETIEEWTKCGLLRIRGDFARRRQKGEMGRMEW